MTVHFYGLVHWEDPTDESLGPVPCRCSPPEGAITKEGMLHYKAGTSYLGREHWKTCFVVLRWEPRALRHRPRPGPCTVGSPAGTSVAGHWGQRPEGGSLPPTGPWGEPGPELQGFSMKPVSWAHECLSWRPGPAMKGPPLPRSTEAVPSAVPLRFLSPSLPGKQA